jgi:tetratricopeptide (TPR) repeat protein
MLRKNPVLGLVLSLCPAIALAQPETTPLPSEMEGLAAIQKIDRQSSPASQLDQLDKALDLLVQPTSLRGAVLCARGSLLVELDRNDEAIRAFEQCQQLRPSDTDPLGAMISLQWDKNNYSRVAQLIMQMIALEPDAAREIGPATMESVIRQLRYSGDDQTASDLSSLLASSGWGLRYPASLSEALVQTVDHELKKGDNSAALRLIPSIVDVDAGVALLIDRRFETIWPTLDRWAAPDLSAQARVMLQATEATWASSGTNRDHFQYIGALEKAGQHLQAIAELEKLIAESISPEDDYHKAMAAIRMGRLLFMLDRPGEAIDVMKAQIKKSPDGEGTVNIYPNLINHLIRSGKHAEALLLLDSHTPKPDEVEHPAAIGYYAALRACALEGSGKAALAKQLLNEVQTTYGMNEDAVRMAMACVGSLDQQAELWIKEARSDQGRSISLVRLAAAKYRAEQGMIVISSEEAMLRRLATRPDVEQVYGELARELPSSFKPALVHFINLPGGAGNSVPSQPQSRT